MTMVLNGLDDIWRQANAFVDEMPDSLIEKNRDSLSSFFKIHAETLKFEVQKRLEIQATGPVQFLDQTIIKINRGDVRESLRDLAIGFVDILPGPEADDFRQSGGMDKRMEGIFSRTEDKAIALMESVDSNGRGIMPATLRLLFKSNGLEANDFYRENLHLVFPKPDGIIPVMS